MRNLLVWLLVAAAVGGGLYLFLAGEDQGPAPGPAPEEGGSSVEEGDALVIDDGSPAAQLAGRAVAQVAADPTFAHVPATAWILGEVARGGTPSAARVALRRIRAFTSGSSAGGMAFIARMLDGGLVPGAPLAEADAGADGRFLFRGLIPGDYELRARDEEGRLVVGRTSIPAVGARVSARLELPNGSETLRGRVMLDDDTPFEGHVFLMEGNRGGFSPFMPVQGRPARTDDAGRFVFAGLLPGSYILNVVSPGRLRMTQGEVSVPRADELLIKLTGADTVLQGRVVAAVDQTPIAGAKVIAGGGRGELRFILRSAMTGADGRFSLPVPGNDGGMIVRAEGYGSQMVPLRVVPQEELVVSMIQRGVITGRLVQEGSGKGAGGAALQAVLFDRRNGFPEIVPGVAGDDGTFRMENVPAGQVQLLVSGGGWVAVGDKIGPGAQRGMPSGTPVMVEAGKEASVEIPVKPSGRVAGVVRTSDGEPVVGAVVTPTGVTDQLSMMLRMMGGSGTPSSAAVTDAEGRFRLAHVPPGDEVRLTVSAVGHAPLQSPKVKVDFGEEATVELTLPVARHVTVTVVSSDGGAPIAGASVRVQGDNERANRIEIMDPTGVALWHTDGEGRVRVGPLPEGTCRIMAEASGFVESREWVEVGADADEARIELTPGRAVLGRIQVPDDVPMAAVEVTVRNRRGRRHVWERTAPDEAGRFRVPGLPEGAYRVRAEASVGLRRFEAEAEIDAGGPEVTLTLEEGARAHALSVKVLGPDGASVPSGRLRLTQMRDGNRSSWSRTFGGGVAAFELESLPDEVYIDVTDVAVHGLGATRVGPLTVGTGPLEVRLTAAQPIEGQITGPSGGVSGVTVQAHPSNHGEEHVSHGRSHGQAVTQADGTFRIEGLGEGSYLLRLDVPDTHLAPDDPIAAKGGATNVRIRLEAASHAAITVLGPDGRPVPEARAQLIRRHDGESHRPRSSTHGEADERGVARVGGLVPGGVYDLHVRPPNERKDLMPLHIERVGPEDRTVKLDRAWVLSGTVVDASGDLLRSGQVFAVQAQDGNTSYKQTNIQDDGSFEFAQMEPGTWTLRAQRDGSVVVFGPTPGGPAGVATEAGQTDVRLTVPVTGKLVVTVSDAHRLNDWTHATLQEEGGHAQAHVSARGSGVFTFWGLEEGKRYRFHVFGIEGNRYLLAEGLSAGGTPTITTQEGLEREVRVEAPAGVPVGNIHVRVTVHGRDLGGRTNAQGRYRFRGLPPGEHAFQARTSHEGTSYQGQVTQGGTGSVVIRLERR